MRHSLDHTITQDLQFYLATLCENKGLGFVYMTLPIGGLLDSVKVNSAQSDRLLKVVEDYPFFATNKNAQIFASKVTAHVVDKTLPIPQKYLSGEWNDEFYSVIEDENYLKPEYQARGQEIMQSTNTKGDVFYSTHQPADEFVGIFHCVSEEMNDTELREFLEKNDVKRLYQLIHFYLTRSYPSLINPKIVTGEVKSKTLRVIQLVGYGLSNKEISDALYITLRGVDYHLDQAKKLLNIKNRAELVFKAKELCLI